MIKITNANRDMLHKELDALIATFNREQVETGVLDLCLHSTTVDEDETTLTTTTFGTELVELVDGSLVVEDSYIKTETDTIE